MSLLKAFRQRLHEREFFSRAQSRAKRMSELEVLESVDLTIMNTSKAISSYRRSSSRDSQLDQLYEVRMHLEAALGMLETVFADIR